MQSVDRSSTLARRLALTLMGVAIASAATATVTGMILADGMIVARVESSALAAARVLQQEVDEEPAMAEHIEAEARSLGIEERVAIESAGSPGCAFEAATGDGEVVCGALFQSRPGRVIVALPVERVRGHRTPLVLAALLVLVVVGAAAGLAGSALSRRFLQPLHQLRHAVVGIDAAAPALVVLPDSTGLEEIDALRDALTHLLHRLDAELGRARQFAASAAHELRTPLATMRTEIELAVESTQTEKERQRMLVRLTQTSLRLETLTDRLLVLATPHEALHSGQCASMAQIAEDATSRRNEPDAARIKVETEDDDAMVQGDEHLLTALLDNLIDNALKFSDGPVRVQVTQSDANVQVDVIDDGPGLAIDEQAALFEPFVRGTSANQRPGHGLGLPLARHITHAFGGTLMFVADGRPHGAIARIRLPAHR